ncbi:MAG: hypothetical protein ACRDOJ_02320 [Nocardioidaceae bacterium]
MDKTAAVADALHLHDSVNLDGGGSTAMSTETWSTNPAAPTNGPSATPSSMSAPACPRRAS